MAVQKSRKSRAKRDMRRANDALAVAEVSIDNLSGETHRRHHITEKGYYRGRKVLSAREDAAT